jgi:hypothetical protein
MLLLFSFYTKAVELDFAINIWLKDQFVTVNAGCFFQTVMFMNNSCFYSWGKLGG